MKIRKSLQISLLLLQVFLLTSATSAFAYSEPTLELGSRQGEFFKQDQNRKAVLFEENITEAYFHNTFENEKNPSPFYSNFEFDDSPIKANAEDKLTSDFQPNGRGILKIQIYPFHSFW